jgi:hypothetical protein
MERRMTSDSKDGLPAFNPNGPNAYSGYNKTMIPTYDPELAETDPGTPMGEYMRRFWHPVCLAEELTDVPRPIRILGEDLVAFRDRSGDIGVLHRHCAHRGRVPGVRYHPGDRHPLLLPRLRI